MELSKMALKSRDVLSAMVALLLLVGGCDYWAPPLEVKMAEDGGAYLIWWQADNARGYQLELRGVRFDSFATTPKPETVTVRRVIQDATLRGLDKAGHNLGYESYWNSPSARRSVNESTVYPLRHGPGAGPFGIAFDAAGVMYAVDWSNLDSAGLTLALWFDSTGTQIVGTSDSTTPGNEHGRSRLLATGGAYPELQYTAAPGDTLTYRGRVAAPDSIGSYWLWLDQGPVGYDTSDHFAAVLVRTDGQAINVGCAYQTAGGLRWLP
jgi:hypothetical protein